MKEFEIWSEGYAATGEHSVAHFQGKSKGNNFDEACINFREPNDIYGYNGVGGEKEIVVKKGTPLKLDKNSDGTYRRGSYRGDLPPGIERTEAIKKGGNYSIWGCQLFDNEKDARKSFG